MSNTTDHVPLGGSKPASAVTGGSVSPSSRKNHIPATAPQQYDIEFLQDTRSQNVNHYPEQTTYVRQSGRGAPSATLTMSATRSAVPGYPAHTVFLDQRPMPQRFLSTVPGHGIVYPPMHPLLVYPETAANMNMPFNHPFPHTYPHYPQQQNQHTPLQHNAPGYQPLGYNSPAHAAVPTNGYGQSYYAPPTYAASHPNVTIHLHSHGPSQNEQAFAFKASAAASKETKSRTLDSEYDVSKTIVDGSTPMRSAQAQPSSLDSTSIPTNSPGPTTPRGPPRKPKQSGHALWVGNLPPGTDIHDLKDYFSQDATKDVESVFLISKSNCAFVNYKTEESCLAALSRFHDSRFYGARLVCRLRRGSLPPAPQTESPSVSVPTTSVQAENSADNTNNVENENVPIAGIPESRHPDSRIPNRYFIVKSLTLDDLQMSRESGIWATQAHNEGNLNQAYQTADNVYLIFSANKSGEYYGYARMVSPIQEDDGLTMEIPSRPNQTHAEPEELDVTPTPATSTAPDGRIINDLARGTIFWEADSSEDEDGNKTERNAMDVVDEVADSGFQSIRKPFRIQWLSIERVPFHRTRGLRNPWNANREIKIARDGTEIEPAVGERLVKLFHTPYSG